MSPDDWARRREIALGFARHWGCQPHEAEDIAQQALLLAWAALPTVINEGWLFVVTRRLVSRMRLRGRRETVGLSDWAPRISMSDEFTILLHEIARLQELSAADRALLRDLVYGRSHTEIAARRGYGTKSVGIRVHRLVRKIQRAVHGGLINADSVSPIHPTGLKPPATMPTARQPAQPRSFDAT